MTMKKNSSENQVCAWCDKPAIPGTNPPACRDHIDKPLDKKASDEQEKPENLKQLESFE